jgi:hypothetical protein
MKRLPGYPILVLVTALALSNCDGAGPVPWPPTPPVPSQGTGSQLKGLCR